MRCILDSGSQAETITEEAAQQLQVPTRKSKMRLLGIGGSLIVDRKIAARICSQHREVFMDIELAVVRKIVDHQPIYTIPLSELDIPENIPLADPDFNLCSQIDILLGARVFYQILGTNQLRVGRGPTFQESSFGWLAVGVLTESCRTTALTCAKVEEEPREGETNNELHELFKQFWKIEELGRETEAPKNLDEEAEEHFINNTIIDSEGRYVVRMPFRSDHQQLGHSFEQARRRYLALETRLSIDKKKYTEYRKFMEEYIEMGHMEPIAAEELHNVRYFIPHSCVEKPDSTSTKLRVVFDASAKTTSGVSLNDVQIVGPNVQRDLNDVLIDFRGHNIVLMADVEKMYRQVKVAEPDTWFQCILYRKDQSLPIRAYRLTTVTYGEASSSFLACRALKQVAVEERETSPQVADAIENCFYVDNLMLGAPNVSELKKLKTSVAVALKKRCFPLRKWASNTPTIIEDIKEEDLETTVTIGDQDIIKTLGIAWNPIRDTFSFAMATSEEPSKEVTKRQLASKILKLFDPLGFIQPVLINAKLLLQETWKEDIEWDELIPEDILTSWNKFQAQLEDLKEFTMPRQAFPSECDSLELHGFSDASGKAYGCAVYMVAKTQGEEITSRLLCAKSRVAPKNMISQGNQDQEEVTSNKLPTKSTRKSGTTLPKLELQAALLLAEVCSRIRTILKGRITAEHYWCDSQIALTWIKTPISRWEVFVRNRTRKIQNLTMIDNWHYVKSAENPADLVSRGTTVKKFLGSKKQFWLNGPTFLTEDDYPNLPIEEDAAALAEEVKKICLTQTTAKPVEDYIEGFRHHNSFRRTRRHFALINRAINNFMAKSQSLKARGRFAERRIGPLTVEDLEEGLNLAIRIMQLVKYPEEAHSIRETKKIKPIGKFQHVKPRLINGLIHVTWRLSQADVPFTQKMPILIPNNHPFAKVIIEHIHRELLHAGAEVVLVQFRKKYWMRNMRKTVQGVLNRCVLCVRNRPKQFTQQMGQLPHPRVNPSPAFTHTGVDLCGPFTVTAGTKSRTKSVVYVCIFICLATKAIHLEVVENQSAGAFISALVRFTSLRGRPEVIYSDNGRNFVGASRELSQLRKIYNKELFQHNIIDLAAEKGINFSFIPPRSPNFGGLWEANIKTAKRLFKGAGRGAQFSLTELQTLFHQIAAIMNSRPLTVALTNVEALEPLTPAHFLIGRPIYTMPLPAEEEESININVRWKRVNHQAQQFWKRWREDYLHQLRNYTKWNNQQRNLEVGEIVLIGDDHVPVANWPMGIVTEVFKGPDDIVRVATIRTATGTYKRNVRVLAPLPIEVERSSEDSVTNKEAVEEFVTRADNNTTIQPTDGEMEEDQPPSASERIWDGRLRPKGGRKWR